MSPELQERLTQQVSDLLTSGCVLGTALDYTQEDYELIYALGHSLYAQARYADASKVLSYLVMHNHLERRFVAALAASLQMQGHYQEALTYHAMCAVMDLSDPKTTFHTGECLLALGMAANATKALRAVMAQAQAGQTGTSGTSLEMLEQLAQRAQALLDLIPAEATQTAAH